MIQQEKKTHKVFAGTLMCLSFAAALLSLALYVRMPPAEAAASPYPDESEIWADEELPEEGSGEPANTGARRQKRRCPTRYRRTQIRTMRPLPT